MLSNLFKGILVGLLIAVPVGPIGLLCIRRSLEQGRLVGLATGLGAATADAAFSSVAAFGLTAIYGFVVSHTAWLHLVGGAALCYLGARLFRRPPALPRHEHAEPEDLLSAYLSTLLLTLANPVTILSFIAIFAGLGLTESENYSAAAMLVAGVFAGSAIWWLSLSMTVASMRRHVSPGWMKSANRFAGAAVFAFGIFALATPYLK